MEGKIVDKKAIWPLVPQGEHTVVASTGEMRVSLSGDTEVQWQPLPFNAILLIKLDAGGVFEATGFAARDLIVRIDGQSYEGEALRTALANARNAESVSLEVDRNGQSLVIQMEGATLNSALRDRTPYRFVRR
jgi:C-terminal processing protease CtpA/Prc